MGGDFNLDLGKAGQGGRHDLCRRVLCEVLGRFSLIDAFPKCCPGEKGVTWRNSRGDCGRLDYFFVTSLVQMGRAGLVPLWFTDYDGLTVDLILDTPVFGSGYWKLNVNILEEREFKNLFYRAFEGWVSLKGMAGTTTEWWEGVKLKIRKLVQAYCGKRKALGGMEGARLQIQLEALYCEFNSGGVFDLVEAVRLKGLLREHYERRAREFLFRAQGEELVKGERCTAYFFGEGKRGAEEASD